MRVTTYLALLLVLYSVQANAQWISVEASMGPSSSQTTEEFQDISGSFTYGLVDGMDTIYIRNRYSGHELNQRQISNYFSFAGFVKVNIPLKPRLTLSTGLGLSSAAFSHRNVVEILEYNFELDTLNNFVPSPGVGPSVVIGGGSGSNLRPTEEGLNCDSLYIDPNGPSIDFNKNSNRMHRLVIPLELSYWLIPDAVNLMLGAHFNFLRNQTQRFPMRYRGLANLNPYDSITVCRDYARSVNAENPDAIAELTIAIVAGLEVQITKELKVFTTFSKYVNSFTTTNPNYENSRFEIRDKYYPINMRIGMSIDLGKRKNLELSKTKYLFGPKLN